jgi:hypothetical protein
MKTTQTAYGRLCQNRARVRCYLAAFVTLATARVTSLWATDERAWVDVVAAWRLFAELGETAEPHVPDREDGEA